MQLLLVTALAIAYTSHVTRPSPAIRAACMLQLFTPGFALSIETLPSHVCSFNMLISERCSRPLSHHVYAPRMVTTVGKSVLFPVHSFIFLSSFFLHSYRFCFHMFACTTLRLVLHVHCCLGPLQERVHVIVTVCLCFVQQAAVIPNFTFGLLPDLGFTLPL